MTVATIICRQSKNSEGLKPLKRQEYCCKRFCQENNYKIFDVLKYVGSGWKGYYSNKLLLKYIEKLPLNSKIIVYTVDRFCRNIDTTNIAIKALKLRNITIISLFDNLNSHIEFNFNLTSKTKQFKKLINIGHKESELCSKRQKLAIMCRKMQLNSKLNKNKNKNKTKKIKLKLNLKSKI